MSGVSSTNSLKQSGEFAPEIRSAGKVCKVDEVHVAELTSQYNADVLETPDKIKAFSHRGPNVGEMKQNRWNSNKTQTATHELDSFNRQHHDVNGVDTNSELVDNHATRKKEINNNLDTRKTSKEHDTIEKCLRPGLYANKMTALIEEQRQRNYLSERRKPLGRTPAPLFNVITPANGFGKSSNTNNDHHEHDDHNNDDDAKEDIIKGTKINMNNESNGVASAINAWREVEPMYLPGEQYDRLYDWERIKIDPTTYRFGVNKPTLSSNDNVNNNTSSGGGANSVFPPASHAVHDDLILVPKLVCDYYKTTSSEIGKSKPGVMNNVKNNTISIGEQTPVQRKIHSKSNNQLTVREVLTGWAENKPREEGTETGNTEHNSVCGIDSKLSNNSNNNKTEQFQSCTNVHDELQVSRLNNETSNIHVSGMKDDVTAEQLLHPCNYVQLGVESKYFAGARSLESIWELCYKAHFPLSDDEINHVYKCVIEREGKCGIEQFKNAAVAMGFM